MFDCLHMIFLYNRSRTICTMTILGKNKLSHMVCRTYDAIQEVSKYVPLSFLFPCNVICPKRLYDYNYNLSVLYMLLRIGEFNILYIAF